MPGRTKKAVKRSTKPRRSATGGRRRRIPRLPKSVPEMASCSELILVADGTSNTMYGPNTVGLDQFPRARAIASQYQEFRITNIKWTFKPRFDTFTATTDAATQITVPQLFYMIDKAQSIPLAATLATLRSMGARPHRFDDKNVLASYAPGVVIGANNGALASTLSKPLIAPWLSTNLNPDAVWAPNSVDHSGIYFYLDCGGLPGDGTYQYGVECEVQFQFRKPLMVVRSSEEAPSVARSIFDVSGNEVA